MTVSLPVAAFHAPRARGGKTTGIVSRKLRSPRFARRQSPHRPPVLRGLCRCTLRRLIRAGLTLAVLAAGGCITLWAQSSLPDAPSPNPQLATSISAVAPAIAGPVAPGSLFALTPASLAAGATTPDILNAMPADPLVALAGQQTFPPESGYRSGSRMRALHSGYLPLPTPCVTNYCTQSPPPHVCCQQSTDAFSLYLQHNALHVFTPRELGAMAIRSVIDPFNLLTIVGTSAYSVATDAHSRYGPGAMGIAKVSGTLLTQDMTIAFVETFLIPSIDHQDPRYHRLPNASLARRVAHCLYQPFWTDSDTGRGMVNYSTIVGSVIVEAVDSSYVPYQRVGWGPGAERVATGWATDPAGNFVSEFLPDLARHVNISIVFVQRLINRVAIQEGSATP